MGNFMNLYTRYVNSLKEAEKEGKGARKKGKRKGNKGSIKYVDLEDILNKALGGHYFESDYGCYLTPEEAEKAKAIIEKLKRN